MMKTYLFYDLETTGRNKCFDQVLQFAAIRTDLKLHEIERHQIQVKLNPDIIPDPEALLIHHIPIADMREGEPEITAMTKIHALLNTPGTISCGYNTLGFDDEFLRFSFYRNFLQPYTHQWAGECSRMDLLPITMVYYLYKNATLNWPMIDGMPSLKLENLSAKNQLTQGMAHNALADVEATVALARLLMREQKMWDYLVGYFNKQTDIARMNQLNPTYTIDQKNYHLGLMIGEAGTKDFYQFPVLSLGQHNHYKNQSLWLRLDKSELLDATIDSIAQSTWAVHKKVAEPGFILPFSDRYTQHLTQQRLDLTQKNLSRLQTNVPLLRAIAEYHREFTYPKIPNVDADAALYDNGFLNNEEQRLCTLFHTVAAEKKANIVSQHHNPRLKELGIRLLSRHYADYTTEDFSQLFNRHLQKIYAITEQDSIVDYKGNKRLTAATAIAAIEQLINSGKLNTAQLDLLKELTLYISAQLKPGPENT